MDKRYSDCYEENPRQTQAALAVWSLCVGVNKSTTETVKQILQDFKTGKVSVTDVQPPLAQRGRVLVRTAASLISAGTERMSVELGKKSPFAQTTGIYADPLPPDLPMVPAGWFKAY